MPDIGRWGVVDPLAEKAPNWTPYRYAFNNPVKYIDPKGLFETKFGAWWHRTWNGGGSKIFQDKNNKDYYYTQKVGSGTDANGGVVINMRKEYGHNASKESGYPVLKIQAKADLGVGIGGKAGVLQGKAAILNQDIGYLQYDAIANKGTAKLGDGKVDNSLELAAGLGKKSPISIGAGIDYNYDYNSVKDNGISGVKGTEQLDWSLKAGLDIGPGVGNGFESLDIQPSVGSGGVVDTGAACYCIDLGVGVKVLLGAEVKILIGIQK